MQLRVERNFTFALCLMVSAIFLFDVQGAFVKHLTQHYPVSQVMVFRNLFGLIPGIILLYLSTEWRTQDRPLLIDKWQLAVGRGVLLVLAQVCFYFAVSKLALATATTLVSASPVFVTVLSIPLLGHRVGWVRGTAVLCGFIGVVAVMKPTADSFSPLLLLPIVAALCYSLASLSSRFFDSSVPTALINFYSASCTFIGSLLLMLALQSYVPVQSGQDWLFFIMMGLAGGCAVFLMISAYRMWEPSSLSPFEYFGILFSFILGYLFFNEAPVDRLFPGVVLIVGGGLMVFWRERHLARQSAQTALVAGRGNRDRM